MLAARIAGQPDPKALAQLARGSMRSKLAVLEQALTGHFDDHHGLLCQHMLDRIDAATTTIDQVTAEIDRLIARSPSRSPSSMRSVGSAWSPPKS